MPRGHFLPPIEGSKRNPIPTCPEEQYLLPCPLDRPMLLFRRPYALQVADQDAVARDDEREEERAQDESDNPHDIISGSRHDGDRVDIGVG